MFQYLHHPRPERGAEILKDQMRVRFRDRPARGVGDVVSEEDIVQAEACGGAVREMGHRQRGGGSSVLVQEDEVRQAGGVCARDEVGEDEVPAVEADGGGEEEADFFGESGEPGGGGAGGGYEDAGVGEAGEVGVFVVEVEFLLRGDGGLGFVVFVVCAEGFVVGDGGGEWLAGCEGSF